MGVVPVAGGKGYTFANAYDKISDKDRALLLLASLSKIYKPIVHTLLVGMMKISLDEAMTALRENNKMMAQINGRSSDDDGGLEVESPERGRNQDRNGGSPSLKTLAMLSVTTVVKKRTSKVVARK